MRDLVLLCIFAKLGEIEFLHPVAGSAEVAVVHEIALDTGDVGGREMGYADI